MESVLSHTVLATKALSLILITFHSDYLSLKTIIAASPLLLPCVCVCACVCLLTAPILPQHIPLLPELKSFHPSSISSSLIFFSSAKWPPLPCLKICFTFFPFTYLIFFSGPEFKNGISGTWMGYTFLLIPLLRFTDFLYILLYTTILYGRSPVSLHVSSVAVQDTVFVNDLLANPVGCLLQRLRNGFKSSSFTYGVPEIVSRSVEI